MNKFIPSKTKIGICTPLANEENTIVKFCTELTKEINRLKLNATVYMVIDGASKDKTEQLLKKITSQNKKIKYKFDKNSKNVADAYISTFNMALDEKCEYIIEMDAGFSHQPKELEEFIRGFQEGYDCVFGIRPLYSLSYKVPFKRRLFSVGGTLLGNLLLGTNYKDMTSGYEGFKSNVVKEILEYPIISKGHFFQTEIKYRSRKFSKKEVKIDYNFPSPSVNKNSIFNSFDSLFKLFLERLRTIYILKP